MSSMRSLPPPLSASTRPTMPFTVMSPPAVSSLASFEVAGNVDDELAGAEVMASTLPVAVDPGGIPLRRCIDLVGFKFAPGLLLIRSIGTSADHIGNVLLRAALHTNGTEIHVHPEILARGKGAGDFLGPGITVAEYPHLLRSCDRNQECGRDQHSRDL